MWYNLYDKSWIITVFLSKLFTEISLSARAPIYNCNMKANILHKSIKRYQFASFGKGLHQYYNWKKFIFQFYSIYITNQSDKYERILEPSILPFLFSIWKFAAVTPLSHKPFVLSLAATSRRDCIQNTLALSPDYYLFPIIQQMRHSASHVCQIRQTSPSIYKLSSVKDTHHVHVTHQKSPTICVQIISKWLCR